LDRRSPGAPRRARLWRHRGRSESPCYIFGAAGYCRSSRQWRSASGRSAQSIRCVSAWKAAKAGRVLRALNRIGWTVKRQTGSHRGPRPLGLDRYRVRLSRQRRNRASNACTNREAYWAPALRPIKSPVRTVLRAAERSSGRSYPSARSTSPALAWSRSAHALARAPTSSPIRPTPRSSTARARPSRISSTTPAPLSASPV